MLLLLLPLLLLRPMASRVVLDAEDLEVERSVVGTPPT